MVENENNNELYNLKKWREKEKIKEKIAENIEINKLKI